MLEAGRFLDGDGPEAPVNGHPMYNGNRHTILPFAEPATDGLLDAAIDYLQRGWSIIPVKGKKPALRSWKQYQQQRPTEDEVRRWFGAGSSATGVAVICGRVSGDLICRDFDEAGSYERWAAAHPDLAAQLPTVKTGRGYHVYATCPEARSATLPDGELRSDGNYVVLPPSQHESGAVYTWIIEPSAGVPVVALDPKDQIMGRPETETQRHRDPETQMASESLSLCLSVSDPAVQRAITRTLPTHEGGRNRCVFRLARELKAIRALDDAPLQALQPIAREWHRQALPVIGTKPYDETWADFAHAWPRVRTPAGHGVLESAFARAKALPLPAGAARYECEHTRALIALCAELQRLRGQEPYYLSCRSAARLLGIDHHTASRRLGMLVADGVLIVAEPGTTTRATRYEYAGPSRGSAEVTP